MYQKPHLKIILKYLPSHEFSITIRDNGVGASPERLNNINKIEEFNFAISGVCRSGIGLKITKQIVDLHNGGMLISSQLREYFHTTITLDIIN